MKKKYLAVLLACLMTIPCFLTSCGRIADEIVQEEDDEDDEDEDEEEDEGPVFVDVLEDSDLKDQIKLLVKARATWEAGADSSAVMYGISYCVTDLDHNGRLEVVSVTRFEYGEMTECHLYEVNEKISGLDEAKWKWKGIDLSSDSYPDFDTYSEYYSYYDKKKEVTRYLLTNNYDNGNNEYGLICCDLMYSNGKIECYNYAGAVMESDWVFSTDDDTDIDGVDDFNDYLDSYPKKADKEEIEFGLYTEGYRDGAGLSGISDEDLSYILTDSYKVFAGEKDFDEYDETYNIPAQSQDSDEISYDDMVGRWILYSSDDGYNVDYYDEDSQDYFTLIFYRDYESLFTVYFDGEASVEEYLTVDLSGIYPTMELYDPDHDYLDESVDYIQMLVMDLSDDGQDLHVYYLAYDEDGFIEEGYDLIFRKDKTFSFSNEYSYDSFVGDWGIISSELEGDVTYYEEDGYRYFTLSVYDDKTVTMKEYENGRVFLEINADVEIDPVGPPYFRYDDQESLNSVVAFEIYTLDGFVDDEDTLQVSIDFYDADNNWLGYTILKFERL